MKSIPLCSGDLKFLLKSDSTKETIIPNCVIIGFKINKQLQKDEIVSALCKLTSEYPQLKTNRFFEPNTLSWTQTSESLNSFFSNMVTVNSTKIDDETSLIEKEIKKASHYYPFEIIAYNNYFLFKLDHTFADAKYGFQLIELLFKQLSGNTIKLTSGQFGAFPNTQLLKKLLQQENKTQPAIKKPNQSIRKPHFAGNNIEKSISAQKAFIKTLDSKQVDLLYQIKKTCSKKITISINTLLNVLLMYQAQSLGWQNKITAFSIPTHLSRYQENVIYMPYNFLSNIRVYCETPNSPTKLCLTTELFQKQVNEYLAQDHLIHNLLKDTEKCENSVEKYLRDYQDDYIEEFTTCDHTFVISNIGFTNSFFDKANDYIDQTEPIVFSAICFGNQPVTFYATRNNNNIYLSSIYDADRVTKKEFLELISVFDTETLKKILSEIS